MFSLYPSLYDEMCDIRFPINQEYITSESMKYFDKDGYELNELEQMYYRTNGIDIDRGNQHHVSNQIPWVVGLDNTDIGVVLDHSFMVQRWEYTERARDQLLELKEEKPILNKLLGINKKWGFDFSIDYVDVEECFELFHIEFDSFDFDEVLEMKRKAEKIIMSTDWNDAAAEVLELKNEWLHLNSDDQSDWKAQHFGWHRAFDNKKVIS